mmetsp:Transcript_46495/g.123423  ORF Transcript_46495/g.123423 Transcript_46495/m.123423 type:complete len:108 (+) Transcript_46495:498-821(+)
MLAQPSFADRARKARIGQMLATPLTSLQPGCQGEEGKNRRLCELGVNVGDVVFGASGDAYADPQGLEEPYNLVGISPERETAGNTIGGDWFGHVSDAPVTRKEVEVI